MMIYICKNNDELIIQDSKNIFYGVTWFLMYE